MAFGTLSRRTRGRCVGEAGAVAGGEDARVGGAPRGVDADAVLDREAGASASASSGSMPMPTSTRSAARRSPSASSAPVTRPSAPVSRMSAAPSRMSTPWRAVQVAEIVGGGGGGDAGEDARRRLDQGDGEPLLARAPPRPRGRCSRRRRSSARRPEASAAASASASARSRMVRTPARSPPLRPGRRRGCAPVVERQQVVGQPAAVGEVHFARRRGRWRRRGVPVMSSMPSAS